MPDLKPKHVQVCRSQSIPVRSEGWEGRSVGETGRCPAWRSVGRQSPPKAGPPALSSAGRAGLGGAVGRILTPRPSRLNADGSWERGPPGSRPQRFLLPLSGSQGADLRLGEGRLPQKLLGCREFPSGPFPLRGEPGRGGPQFGGVGLFQGALACSSSPHTFATVSRHFHQQ